jgi:hypothetical protein
MVFQFFEKFHGLAEKKDTGRPNHLFYYEDIHHKCLYRLICLGDVYLTSEHERIDAHLVERILTMRQEVLDEFKQTEAKNSLLEQYTQRLLSIVDNDKLRSTFIDWLVEVVDEGGFSSMSGDWRQPKYCFHAFIEHLRSTIPDSQILLSTEVTKVKYIADSGELNVEVVNVSEKPTTSLLTCDHVIWTTSLGYLKENFSRIFAGEYDLIDQKHQAIKNLPFCATIKVRRIIYGFLTY